MSGLVSGRGVGSGVGCTLGDGLASGVLEGKGASAQAESSMVSNTNISRYEIIFLIFIGFFL
jgi:hypothetical protein